MKHTISLNRTVFSNLCLYSLILTTLLATASCSKDKSGSDLLMSTTWKISSITNTPNTKDFSKLNNCEKSDLVIFKTGGVVTYDNTDINCAGTYNKQWLLSADEKSITIEDGAKWTACSINSADTVWIIDTLTEDTLVIHYSEDCQGMSGYPWEITITFKKS